jgi:hypothetical protein
MKVSNALSGSNDPLYDLGFREGRGGEMSAANCRVNIYGDGKQSELRIVLPNGNVVWGYTTLHGITAAEIRADNKAEPVPF